MLQIRCVVLMLLRVLSSFSLLVCLSPPKKNFAGGCCVVNRSPLLGRGTRVPTAQPTPWQVLTGKLASPFDYLDFRRVAGLTVVVETQHASRMSKMTCGLVRRAGAGTYAIRIWYVTVLSGNINNF